MPGMYSSVPVIVANTSVRPTRTGSPELTATVTFAGSPTTLLR